MSRTSATVRMSWAGMFLTLALSQTGCVGLESFTQTQDGPPQGPVCKIVATWIPQVVATTDPTRDGTPTPCLAGRVYLFDSNMNHTLKCDGTLTVDMYDPSVLDVNHQPKHLERWIFDADTLNQKLLKHDFFDWGYTMGMPWLGKPRGSYRPDLTRVELRVRYQPKEGPPLYSDPAQVTLAGQGDQPAISTTRNVKH